MKSFFRPISIMVPDFKLIAEIELLSAGFRNAKSLSIKLVTVFRLCSELLSHQPHYDFGMRALKTALRLTKMHKIERSELPEEIALLRSVSDVILSKLVDKDVLLFKVNITSHILIREWVFFKCPMLCYFIFRQFFRIHFPKCVWTSPLIRNWRKRSKTHAKTRISNALSTSCRKYIR